MGHRLDVGDVIDMLEESVLMRTPVVVELRSRTFEDRATQIFKWNGEDHVAFQDHEAIPISEISSTRRAVPRAYSYAGKRGLHP
jgi:hypothetical protein